MKRRLLSILLALVMLLTTAPTVFATNESDAHQELIDLACEIFPEYENKILYQEVIPSSVMRSSEVTLVHSESRKVSDSKTLQYSEYSDGVILLTETDQTPVEISYVDIPNGSTSTGYTLTVRATCAQSPGVFTAANILFTIYLNAYDKFNSIGTYSKYTPPMTGYEAISLNEETNPYVRMSETASKHALIQYDLVFRFGAQEPRIIDTHLTIDVGEDNFIVSHESHD